MHRYGNQQWVDFQHNICEVRYILEPGRRRPTAPGSDGGGHSAAQVIIQLLERTEQADEGSRPASGAAAAGAEVSRPEAIRHGDYRRAHGPVLVRAFGPRHVAVDPEREAHCYYGAR
jgi:hypothetical protein